MVCAKLSAWARWPGVAAVAAALAVPVVCCTTAPGEPGSAPAEPAPASRPPAISRPADAYAAFNEFCAASFGAEKEPLVYQLFGKELRSEPGGAWVHASATSACIAWETNLPAATFVEYGPTPSFGAQTPRPERNFHIHVHYLKDLKPRTTYYYRLVSIDERGNKAVSDTRSFNTGMPDGAIEVPGKLDGPPYRLDKPGATYVLTRDLTVRASAIEIAADGVTLDLDAHTVTFAGDVKGDPRITNGISAGKDPSAKVPQTIAKVRILNGTVVQGSCKALEEYKGSFGLNGLFLAMSDGEIGGVTVEHHSPESWGGVLWNPQGSLDVHHNVFLDRATKVADRHGAAARSLGISEKQPGPNAFRIHHNLVKRTRQNGLGGAHELAHNEVCVDSWCTNSFALQPISVPDTPAGEVHDNRVFATGFNPYALGWAHRDLKVWRNLVHMRGIDAKSRWYEDWGDISMCEGFRVTNYGIGGQVRDNLEYWNNVIIIEGTGGSELRGTGFFSDETISNLLFRDNVLKVLSLDDKTVQAACISAHGLPSKSETAMPVYYRNNTLISNICNVRFGDKYGKGSNHRIVECRLIREGNDPRYHTFAFGGTYWCRHNVVQDCEFVGGASYNDVLWGQTGQKSFYDVKWTLNIKGPPGAAVSIKDASGQVEFAGTINHYGDLAAPLTQCRISPPKVRKDVNVPTTERTETPMTPHTVTLTATKPAVKATSKQASQPAVVDTYTATVNMDRKRTLELKDKVLAEPAAPGAPSRPTATAAPASAAPASAATTSAAPNPGNRG
ncbi:MAG: fibronectin type III domain-containing protein [Phycisphaerae bacterium]